MIKKSITYEDWDGSQKTKECYFNMTKAELFEFSTSYPNGFPAHAEETISNGSQAEVLRLFKDIISKAYGEKHDGVFIKTPELTQAFLASDAYSSLMLSMMSSLNEAVAFFNGIMPKSIQDELMKQKVLENIPGVKTSEPVEDPVNLELPFDEPTQQVRALSLEDLRAELGRRSKE